MIDIKDYNKEGTVLRKQQLKMLDMLIYVDNLCRKNNIVYYLSGGTLLGAVRHKGFIPWDDDLDIVLFKDDFKKLNEILLKSKHTNYILHSNKTDVNYVAPYNKLRLENTLIHESNNADLNYKYRGIYIDLFYVEPANKISHYISDLFQTRLLKFSNSKKRKNPIINLFFLLYNKLLRNIFYPLLSCLSLIFNSKRVSYPLGSFFHTQFEKKHFPPPIELEFEGYCFYVPHNYKEILEAQYGDYMKLPLSESIVFHITHVEFND